MKSIYLLLLLFALSTFSNETNYLKVPFNSTSGLEPIQGLGEDFQKAIQNAELNSVDDENLKEKIQNIISARLNSFNINNQYGISVAYYTPTLGLQTATAGYSDIVTKDPITPDMTFQIASITKWMVSTLIFKLQEEGKLDLTDEISKYLPDYPNVNSSYTIASLLSHRTDIYDYFNRNPQLFLSLYTNPNQAPTLDQILDNLPAYQRQNPQSSEYSNTNYLLLAKIIEEVTGEDYYEYLKSTIIEPLGLDDTYNGRFPQDNDNPVAEGWFNDAYWRTGISRMSDVDLTKLMDLSYGLGDMYATPSDLIKYVMAWGNEEIISESSINTQIINHGGGIGHGVFLERIGAKNAFFHSGSLLGYQSMLYTIPEDDFAIAVCINTNNAGFSFYPMRMQSVISNLILDIYEVDLNITPKLQIHEMNIVEITGNQNGKIDKGEQIELKMILRDISGGVKNRENIIYNLSSTDVSMMLDFKNGNFIETGYSYLDNMDGKFTFTVPENFDGDFINFNLKMSDNAEKLVLEKDFTLPVGETKSSAYFDGSYASTVQVPLSQAQAPDAMSFEAWMSLGDMSKIPGGQISSLAWIGYNTAVFVVNSGNSPSLFVQLQQANGELGQALISDPELQFSKWVHIAFTYNENNQLKIYLNGNEKNYTINEGRFASKIGNHYPQIMTIGSMPTLADANQIPNFIGYLDEVRYWGRALSQEEIIESMEGNPSNSNELIANINFDHGVSSYHPLSTSAEQSANFHTYYGPNTDYIPGEFVSSVDNSKSEDLPLFIYPNPSSNFLNIDIEGECEIIKIYDLHGLEVARLDSKSFNQSKNTLSIDISSLLKGAYMLEAKSGEKTFSKLFIKK